jgi:hypothetical protein
VTEAERNRITFYLTTIASSGPKKEALKGLSKSISACFGIPVSGVRLSDDGVRQDVLVARTVLEQMNPELLADIEGGDEG